MNRVWCYLWGCSTGDFPCCDRCGADSYSGEFRESGPLDRLHWRLTCWWRAWVLPRCLQCGKLLIFRVRHREEWCSEACFRKWTPF